MKATVFIALLTIGSMIELFGATSASYEKSDLILLDKAKCDHKCYLVKAGNVDGKFIPVVELDEIVISAKRPDNKD